MAETVTFKTSMGEIVAELDSKAAPITVKNFLSYATSGFYEGTVFHRVIPGFMIQTGGFTAEGKEKATKPPITLESGNGLKNNLGTLAMARTSDPDSATSQFFISVANNDFLNKTSGSDGYAVFGKVISGMDVVMAISKVKTSSRGHNDDWPVSQVVIEKVTVKS